MNGTVFGTLIGRNVYVDNALHIIRAAHHIRTELTVGRSPPSLLLRQGLFPGRPVSYDVLSGGMPVLAVSIDVLVGPRLEIRTHPMTSGDRTSPLFVSP